MRNGRSQFDGKRIDPPKGPAKPKVKVSPEEHDFIVAESAKGKGPRAITRMFFRKFGRDITEMTVYAHVKAARDGE